MHPQVVTENRIIPAYAGSTGHELQHLLADSDHPRIRGEHDKLETVDPIAMGSSPHTRGAHAVGAGYLADPGIIPAYAGSTLSSVVASSSPADHPRIRGEHRALNPGGVFSAGSSPHTRGAPTKLCM